MTRLILILVIIFLLLTVLRSIVKRFRLNDQGVKRKPEIKDKSEKFSRDDITDAKFEEMK